MHIFRAKKWIVILGCVFVFGGGVLLFLLFSLGHTPPWRTSPYDYPGSVWASEDPEIWLYVPETNISTESSDAWIVYNGEKVQVSIEMDERASSVLVSRKGELRAWEALIDGEIIKRSSTHVVIRVYKDRIFEGQYETITLTRVDG